MKEIFSKILYHIREKQDIMLITLISSNGSAPRKTGALMLVGKEGLIMGTIGGGAVEMRSVASAQSLLAERRSAQHTFQLRTNDKEDIGMICGGDVTVLFQFIGADDPLWKEICENLTDRLGKQQGGWFVQDLQGGAPALFDTEFNLLCGNFPEGITPARKNAVQIGNSFWMPLPIPERVIIFGGGHIAAALVPLLKTVGFRSWVLDDRPEFTAAERFPLAEKRITCDFSRIGEFVEITEDDFAVIMTNGHKNDFESELFVLRGPFAYIGVIGSRRKTASVNQRLRENGISEELIGKVHTPIGTAIKAVTPEEIAVSIAGELILVRAERREKASGGAHSCPMS